MSFSFSTSEIRCPQHGGYFRYKIKIAPKTESIYIWVKGNYEIAVLNGGEPNFSKSLFLTCPPNRETKQIEAEIVVHSLENASEGRVIHQSFNTCEVEMLDIKPISTSQPYQETANFFLGISKKMLNFGELRLGEIAVLPLEISTQDLTHLTLSADAPFEIALEKQAFSKEISLPLLPSTDRKGVYVRFVAKKEGVHKGFLTISHPFMGEQKISLVARSFSNETSGIKVLGWVIALIFCALVSYLFSILS
ncbi:MAG: hypothetical protein ACKVTZ_07390 [Bacteroidia bacterium]